MMNVRELSDRKTHYHLFTHPQEFRLWYSKGRNRVYIYIPGPKPLHFFEKKAYIYVYTETILATEESGGPLMCIKGFTGELIHNPTNDFVAIY